MCSNQISPLNNITSFRQFAHAASTAQEQISFWGHRCIVLKPSNDRIPIDSFCLYFIRLIKNCQTLTEIERNSGKKALKRLQNLYKENDQSYLRKNIFTKILYYLRNNAVISLLYYYPNPRSNVDLFHVNFFDCYTKSEYESTFKKPPPLTDKARFGRQGPQCWLAPREFRNLA